MTKPINPDLILALLALAKTSEIDCDDCPLADNLCFSDESNFIAACDWAITKADEWLGNTPAPATTSPEDYEDAPCPDGHNCPLPEYTHLIGFTYPDTRGRTVTVLDVDTNSRALLERDGQQWGCEAHYLGDKHV
ncbi:MAG: hypothetical protein ABID84_03605 [Chloroflexota bacterium]